MPRLRRVGQAHTIGRMDFVYYAGLALVGFVAGMLGALLGLGGGVFLVPALVLLFQLPALTAVGTSNVAVVATSTAGASSYVRNRLANIRLALVLLISTTTAALASSLIASLLPDRVLSGLFSVILLYTTYSMLRSLRPQRTTTTTPEIGETKMASRLGLGSSYYDPVTGRSESYKPQKVRTGISISLLAGVMAGLLGIGGGLVQMPVMILLMKVPLKVATGTSNFMIGVTATSAAFVRYAHGDIDPLIAVPTALFVFLGARVGAWLVPRTPNARLKLIFGWVALAIAALMAMQALGIYQPPKR